MYRYIVLISLGLTSLMALAQRDVPLSLYEGSKKELQEKMIGVARHYVRASAGLSLPQGEYAAVFAEERAGYARVGTQMAIDGGYVIFRNMGIAASLTRMSNSIYEEAYKKDALERLPSDILGEVKVNKWQHTFMGVGPFISLPEGKLTFDLRALIGFTYTKSPDWIVEGMYENAPIIDQRHSDKATRISMALGGSLSYPLPFNYDFRVFMKGELLTTAPKLNVEHISEGKAYSVQSLDRYQQPISVFVVAIGLRYELGYVKGNPYQR